MKKIILAIMIGCSAMVNAQQFISSGAIEFEVRTNNHRAMGEESMWTEMFKDKIPQFSTTYYQYTFSENKSI